MKNILVVTNADDLHADIVIQEVLKRGNKIIRLHPDEIPEHFMVTWRSEDEGSRFFIRDLRKNICFGVEDVSCVWFRKPRPVPSIFNESAHNVFVQSESQEVIDALFSALNEVAWINPQINAAAKWNKLRQLKIARDIGLNVPRTLITQDREEASRFLISCQNGAIYKTLRTPGLDYNGYSTVIHTQPVKADDLPNEPTLSQPCLFQEYIAKSIELRVTVVGERIFAAEIHSQVSSETSVDWRSNKGFYHIPYATHELPKEIQEAIYRYMKLENLIFSAFDFIRTPDGNYVFLENNPNGEWLWIQIRTNLKIAEALADLLIKS